MLFPTLYIYFYYLFIISNYFVINSTLTTLYILNPMVNYQI